MIGLCFPRCANVTMGFDTAAGVIVYDVALLGFQVNETQV